MLQKDNKDNTKNYEKSGDDSNYIKNSGEVEANTSVIGDQEFERYSFQKYLSYFFKLRFLLCRPENEFIFLYFQIYRKKTVMRLQ